MGSSTTGLPKPPGYPATPALDKLQLVQEQSQACGRFLDWLLGEKNFVLCLRPEEQEDEDDEEDEVGEYLPAPFMMQALLAEFFDIDLVAMDAEKDAILEYQRRCNKVKDAIKGFGSWRLRELLANAGIYFADGASFDQLYQFVFYNVMDGTIKLEGV